MNNMLEKKQTMKYRFLRNKLFVYIGSFTLPVLLVGIISLTGLYLREQGKAKDRLQSSLQLAIDYSESFLEDTNAFQVYLGSAQRMAQFFKVFKNDKIDYDSANALRYLSAYIISLGKTRADSDSIYFYMDNAYGRVLTSGGSHIEDFSKMADQGWLKILMDMKPDETKIVIREMENSVALKEKNISVFRRYPNYKSGTVMNYKMEVQKRKIEQMVFYEDQNICLLNEQNEILLSNIMIEEDEEQALAAWMENNIDGGKVKISGKTYVIEKALNQSGDIQIVTWVPCSTLNHIIFTNMKTLIFLLLATITASVYLAYDRAVRNYQQLYSIIELFDHAEKKMELPRQEKQGNDIYTQILNNIIHTFLENSYLQMQLSERKYRQMSAQMAALQYQINPHFLFNTLQAINYEVLTVTHGRFGNANQMIEYLSDLLRYALRVNDQNASIGEEIDICKKYICIQQLREEKHFFVEWNIDPQLMSCKIKRMLLQPLIENAISHGIKHNEDRSIRIMVHQRGLWIHFKIIDNGDGISEDQLVILQEKLDRNTEELTSDHIGLTNVNQRLILSYGEKSKVHIFSKQHMGTIQYFKITNSSMS